MKQLTIRGVSGDLHLSIMSEAKRRGISLNRYVLFILENAAGLTSGRQNRPDFTDLDEFAGTWTQEDADEFAQQLSTQRNIDPGLW